MNIEQIEITHRDTGKKQKRQVSWLLSDRADWSNDAKPFLITDAKIGEKLHGDFNGKPVKVRMLSKYPYLKSRLEDYEEQREANQAAPIGNDEPTEAAKTEETNQGGIETAEEMVNYLENEGVNFDKRKKKNVEYLSELVNEHKSK